MPAEVGRGAGTVSRPQLAEHGTELSKGRVHTAWNGLRTQLSTGETALYIGAIALCLFMVGRVLGISISDLGVPFAYDVDAVYYQAQVKGLIEHGWVYSNASVGAPSGQVMLDFPNADAAHLILMKFISLFTRNAVIVTNLYYLLGFALTIGTSLFTMRRFGTSRPAAFVASLAFALLPFHFMRGISHLPLASYWAVPLAVLVALRAASGTPPLITDGKFVWRDRESLKALAVAVVIGCSGLYYAFFACLLLVTVAAHSWSKRRTFLFAVPALLLAGAIAGTVLLQFTPSIVYLRMNGPNPEAAQRLHIESELYAFKITQLVLPISGHRLPAFARLKRRYNESITGLGQGLLNENETASLGTLGVLGFLTLLAWSVFRIRPSPRGPASEVIEPLSSMNLTALLFGVFGGFGSLFALLISPQIRAYNRISVCIAFVSLFCAALLLDRFVFIRSWARLPFVSAAIVAVLTVSVVFDQTAPTMAIDLAGLSQRFQTEEEFVRRVEASVPEGSMVFQLPYVPFPGSPPIGQMQDYEHLKAYVHSNTLRWSYGAMRGREGDAWQRQVSGLAAAELIAQLEERGFAGVWVNRMGGFPAEPELEAALGAPLTSSDGNLAFYTIRYDSRRP